MPSRFPGIDPYIEWEHLWPDVHARFVNDWSDAIIDALPDHYSARMNERVNLIEYKPGYRKLIGPDVAIAYREAAVRDQLPTIPISLLPPDRDLRCDLAAVFARTFERGRSSCALRYGPPPNERFLEFARS